MVITQLATSSTADDPAPTPGTPLAIAVITRVQATSAVVRWTSVCALVTFGIVLDWATGPDISMVLVYALGVIVAGWSLGPRAATAALVATSVSAAILQFGEVDEAGFSRRVVVANSCFRVGALGLFALLGAAVRRYVTTVERYATADPLTDTLNRRGLLDALDTELARARRRDSRLTVAFFDLDGLKPVNDREGHRAGDELLRRFACAVRSEARQGDIVGRVGGDEFVLVLPDTDELGARSILERLFSRPDVPSASVGVSTWTPERVSDAAALLAEADAAMYADKQRRQPS